MSLISPLASPLARLLPPLLLLAGGVVTTFSSSRIPPAWQAMLVEVLPFAAMAIAMLLSLRFNRSRYTLLLLLVAVAGISQTFARGQILPATENLLFALLIVNAFAFSLVKDRGLFSVHGGLRIAVLLAQAGALYYLAARGDTLASLFEHEWFGLPASLALFVQLPDAILLLALIVNLGHLLLSIARNSSTQATFFGCQLGLLGIASGYPQAAFVPVLVSCCALMVIVAVIMDSYAMAYRDELTGLASRRALNQALLGLGRRYSIAMLDIDHFKQFNDTHGHDTGDEVLRMVAARIGRVGGGGRAFRYGGEEFTILFPGKTIEQVKPALEALRADIEDYRMQLRRGRAGKKARGRRGARGKSLSVTISIGCAEREGKTKRTEAVIKAADKALYRAKQQGRNRVSI